VLWRTLHKAAGAVVPPSRSTDGGLVLTKLLVLQGKDLLKLRKEDQRDFFL
jgi:hypothetical protein